MHFLFPPLKKEEAPNELTNIDTTHVNSRQSKSDMITGEGQLGWQVIHCDICKMITQHKHIVLAGLT